MEKGKGKLEGSCGHHGTGDGRQDGVGIELDSFHGLAMVVMFMGIKGNGFN